MSIRGEFTIECDQKDCGAEIVLKPVDVCNGDQQPDKRLGIVIEVYAHGWRLDDDERVWCPQCKQEQSKKEVDRASVVS